MELHGIPRNPMVFHLWNATEVQTIQWNSMEFQWNSMEVMNSIDFMGIPIPVAGSRSVNSMEFRFPIPSMHSMNFHGFHERLHIPYVVARCTCRYGSLGAPGGSWSSLKFLLGFPEVSWSPVGSIGVLLGRGLFILFPWKCPGPRIQFCVKPWREGTERAGEIAQIMERGQHFFSRLHISQFCS